MHTLAYYIVLRIKIEFVVAQLLQDILMPSFLASILLYKSTIPSRSMMQHRQAHFQILMGSPLNVSLARVAIVCCQAYCNCTPFSRLAYISIVQLSKYVVWSGPGMVGWVWCRVLHMIDWKCAGVDLNPKVIFLYWYTPS